MLEKENQENNENIINKSLNEIVISYGSINSIIEENKKEDILIEKDDDNNFDENTRLLKERNQEIKSKNELAEVLENAAKQLRSKKNENKIFNEIYENYLDNEFMTKTRIKSKIPECLLKIIFFVVAPIFGIVFLIGIFQMKSLMNALSNLIKKSASDYYHCKLNSICNITISNNETNVYNFYDYYYQYTKNEAIDFNLMMLTGFLGDILLKWKGFKITIALLSLFNLGAIFWLMNLRFDFEEEGIFDYDILKVISFVVIYILFFLGLGGSSLLSIKILIENHLKYKFYLIEKIRAKIKKYDIEKNIENKDDTKTRLIESMKITDLDDKKEQKLNKSNTIYSKKSIKDILEDREIQKQKKMTEKLKNKEKNKFDFFFMICITTIIGYLGKYLMNLVLDKVLIYAFTKNYNIKYFSMGISLLYFISMFFSGLLYQLLKVSIFETDKKIKNAKNQDNNIEIKISQICGYIIYSEKKKPKVPPKKNCCRLCCESTQNCCNETFCNLINVLFCDFCGCDCSGCCPCDCCIEPKCYCSLCEKCNYDPDDYNKKIEIFRYCFKAQRKSFWCNKFMTNETQKKIFPYMIEYFILKLTTIAFEKQYEKYNYLNDNTNSLMIIFAFTFIFYFYFTLSFTRIFMHFTLPEENEDEIEGGNSKKSKLEIISKLSNEILNGTHGILLFNSVFSLIFSAFYLSKMKEDIKSYFFKDNLNVIYIPILMNKFYYFTLNYYCIYTSEDTKKFDIIPGSSLISIYISIWDFILSLIKSNIPDEYGTNDYNYFNILYIIQITFASIPSFFVGLFIIGILIFSTGLLQFLYYGCNCEDCKDSYFCHKYLFCLCSFIFCFGGLWIKMVDVETYEYECCNIGDCCDIGDNCCNVYCYDNIMFCDCCFCNKKSCYYSDCCYKNCDSCKICEC